MTDDADSSLSDGSGLSEDTKAQSIVGGFAFFLSLAALFPTGFLFFILSVAQIRRADASLAVAFLGSCIFGALLSHSMIRDHFSVLLHEFKHALISNLVGNKNKKMKVNRNSGHLVYAYTKKTAHYNAFIALAPYIVPLFTLFATAVSLLFAQSDPVVAAIFIGLAYGTDLLLNIRDISPIQTDITLIRGGYSVGLLYILAWNLLTASLVLAWAFQGAAGIGELFSTVSQVFFKVYFLLSGAASED
jgi:hypothetical protein